MSGYCRDCGNTLCICKLINSNVSIEEHHKTYEELYFESLKIIAKDQQQLKEAEKEIATQRMVMNHYGDVESENEQLEQENAKLKKRLKDAESVAEDFILEKDHLKYCGIGILNGDCCYCMDRGYYNPESCLERAREYFKKWGSDE